MFTVCSKCNLRLTVTATDLRAAQGYVRCGRCANVFNALAALADDPVRAPEQPPAADTQRRPILTTPEPPPPPPPAAPPPPAPPPKEAVRAAADPVPTDTSLEFNPASTNISEVFIEPSAHERTRTFESIILASEDPVAPPEPAAAATPAVARKESADLELMPDALTQPNVTAATQTVAPVAATPATVAVSPPVPPPVPRPAEDALFAPFEAGPAIDAAAAGEIASAFDARLLEPLPSREGKRGGELDPELLGAGRPRARAPGWLVHASAGVLSLALIAQVLHHYRGALDGIAVLHGPLTALYQSLDLPLAPRWNIADYEVRQLGASNEGAALGQLVVRASISNHAAAEQPLPMLRVVMQDRFGNRVAGRDLAPAEYLGPGALQTREMAPGQRVDVQVAFQDPGQAATGFEIDACMVVRDRTVTCANDPGSH